jgi:hypothetical protein
MVQDKWQQTSVNAMMQDKCLQQALITVMVQDVSTVDTDTATVQDK